MILSDSARDPCRNAVHQCPASVPCHTAYYNSIPTPFLQAAQSLTSPPPPARSPSPVQIYMREGKCEGVAVCEGVREWQCEGVAVCGGVREWQCEGVAVWGLCVGV